MVVEMVVVAVMVVEKVVEKIVDFTTTDDLCFFNTLLRLFDFSFKVPPVRWDHINKSDTGGHFNE